MMSAPVARTCSMYIAFTVPAVPTGMKAGVRTAPRGIAISPRRAAPSVPISRKEKRSAVIFLVAQSSSFSPGKEQARIAVGVEAIGLRNRMGISGPHGFETGEGRDKHEQRRARQ